MWGIYLSTPGVVVDLVLQLDPETARAWRELAASSPPREPMDPFYIEDATTTLLVTEVLP